MSTQKRNRQQLQYLRDEALQAYLNREDFQYDLNGDAMYRQYKDRYMELGKAAMEDTMGQAVSLTGGYGSSYAQNVGQQAYNRYLQQLGDVVPELYQLAYDRYRDKGDALYKTYQSWAQLEQEAAEQEQWEREYELAERKRQDENNRHQMELASKNKEQNTQPEPDKGGREGHRGEGQIPKYDDPTVIIRYDNQNVSTGNIMLLQRVLGREETGLWTIEDQKAAGGMTADTAWLAYNKGQLQNRNSRSVGGKSISEGDVKSMERVLGLPEDGIWSKEDIAAAGGLTITTAWEAYTRGLLQQRKRA